MLNDHTPAPFEFYAVEVGLVRIGDSLPAPVFDVRERPNDWERFVQSRILGQGESENDQLRREFWQHYNERYDLQIEDGSFSWVYFPAADGVNVITSFNVRRRDVTVHLQLPDLQDGNQIALMDAYLDGIREKFPDDEVRLLLYTNQWCKTVLKMDTTDPTNWDQAVMRPRLASSCP